MAIPEVPHRFGMPGGLENFKRRVREEAQGVSLTTDADRQALLEADYLRQAAALQALAESYATHWRHNEPFRDTLAKVLGWDWWKEIAWRRTDLHEYIAKLNGEEITP